MARLITINGPLGAGKTWTVNRLKEYFGVQGVHFVDVNFQTPIKELVYELLEIPSNFPYDLFKITKYHDFTGREWMIQLSERSKDLYPYIWVNKVTNVIDKMELELPPSERLFSRVYVADSQGFDVELDFLENHWTLDSDHELLSICIEPPEKRHTRGQKWQADDSRFNLADRMLIDHVLPDSNEAYWFLRNEIQKRGWA